MEAVLKILANEIKKDLGIDEDFLIEVTTSWPKFLVLKGYTQPVKCCCECSPLTSGYKGIYGVEIKINYEHSLIGAVFDLLHEMWHAKQYYKHKGLSLEEVEDKNPFLAELRADFFCIEKILEILQTCLHIG